MEVGYEVMRYKWCTFTFRKLCHIDHIDLRSNLFQPLNGKVCLPRRGGTPKDLAGSMLQELSNLYPVSD